MIIATATFTDIWFGAQPVKLVSFKTKRNGQPAIKYRWESSNGTCLAIPLVSSPSQYNMLGLADRHPMFSAIALEHSITPVS